MSESLITPSPQVDRHWSGRLERAWSELALISMESASHQSLLGTQIPSKGTGRTRSMSEKKSTNKYDVMSVTINHFSFWKILYCQTVAAELASHV